MLHLSYTDNSESFRKITYLVFPERWKKRLDDFIEWKNAFIIAKNILRKNKKAISEISHILQKIAVILQYTGNIIIIISVYCNIMCCMGNYVFIRFRGNCWSYM